MPNIHTRDRACDDCHTIRPLSELSDVLRCTRWRCVCVDREACAERVQQREIEREGVAA